MCPCFLYSSQEVEIALVGKYTKLEDAYASVIKALNHASLALNHKLKLTYIAASDLETTTKATNPVQFHEAWKQLCQCNGIDSSNLKMADQNMSSIS